MQRQDVIRVVMAAMISVIVLGACTTTDSPTVDEPRTTDETVTLSPRPSTPSTPSAQPTDTPTEDEYVHELTTMDLGFHASIPCERCHTADLADEPPPSNCFSCHSGRPHEGPTTCEGCHTPVIWRLVTAPAEHWPLTGAHAAADCFDCHDVTFDVTTSCSGCHGTAHGGLTACERCHTPAGFLPARFSHSSVFSLVGKHATADCTGCHPSRQYARVRGTRCNDCHGVAHGGLTACEQCHTPTGFAATTFNHSSVFTLVGKHAAADCTGCHPSARYAEVRGTRCTNCHGVRHGGRTDCEQCHTPVGWTLSSAFVHASTFGLSGQHLSTPCYECHPGNEFARPIPRVCGGCHTAPHVGPTNCKGCHSTRGWAQLRFIHVPMRYHGGLGVNEICATCHTTGNYSVYTCTICHADGRRYDPVSDL